MKTQLYLILKYWRKHLKSAFALVFSGILLTAVIVVALLTVREQFNKGLHGQFDLKSRAHITLGNSDDELFEKLTDGKNGYNYSVINVLGKMRGYTYGTINDENNIVHIPMEDGQFPTSADELAVDRGVLNKLYWTGKVGDTIFLEDRLYTVVGIIDGIYGEQREQSELGIMYTEPPQNPIPLIFIGESDAPVLYRINYLDNIFDYRKSSKQLSEEYAGLREIYDENHSDSQWVIINTVKPTAEQYKSRDEYTLDVSFFLIIAAIGMAVSVLSVFSVLKSIFDGRKNNISILKRIGMSRKGIIAMYSVECAIFTVVQTALGMALGAGVYGLVFMFKTGVMGCEKYSGLTSDYLVTSNTKDPFIYAALASVLVMAVAYLLNSVTTKTKRRLRKKMAKPRSLLRCFSRAFGQRTVTVVQTVCLVLICFGTSIGYMYYTDNGKTYLDFLKYMPPETYYSVGSFNMIEHGIEEYYMSDPAPSFFGIDSYGIPEEQIFFAPSDYDGGIDDATANLLPDYAYATGFLQQPFIICDEPNEKYPNKIEFYEQEEKDLILDFSSEDYKNFFDEGQLGTKYLYQAKTKLASASVLNSFEGSFVRGVIDLEKINSGKEIIVAVSDFSFPIEVGDVLNLGFAESDKSSPYGITSISFATVRVGAIIRYNIQNPLQYCARTDGSFNLITTASGAETMGMQCARYTEIYSLGTIDGGLIPPSAKMTMQSLTTKKREDLIRKTEQFGGTALLLTVMSLLGFAAYFNGISMKIRLKSYNISVMRAIGAPVSTIRNRLILSGLKIPLIASAISYAMLKAAQLSASGAYQKYAESFFEPNQKQQKMLYNVFFLERHLWEVNAEIPTLILLAVLCAVTFILTLFALKKFKGDIAGDLGEGRTRQ